MMSGLQQIKQHALRDDQPLTAHLELTYACPQSCVFCCTSPSRQQSLSFEQWRPVLDDLRCLGTLVVVLTGGDPMAHPAFIEIAREVRVRRFALRIMTSGMLFDDPMVEEIRRLNPLAVELSFHGASAAVHDRATATTGSFEHLIRCTKALVQHEVRTILKALVTKESVHEIPDMLALCEQLGVPLRIDPIITPKINGDFAPLEYMCQARDVRNLMQQLSPEMAPPETSRSFGGFNCGLGRTTVAISPSGDVFPCLQWRSEAMGNVTTAKLRDLWVHSPARVHAAAVAREVNDELVRRGGAAATYPYCPGIAMQETGDPMIPHGAFFANAEIAGQLRKLQ